SLEPTDAPGDKEPIHMAHRNGGGDGGGGGGGGVLAREEQQLGLWKGICGALVTKGARNAKGKKTWNVNSPKNTPRHGDVQLKVYRRAPVQRDEDRAQVRSVHLIGAVLL
ncbi:unnamed protein product, partial [Lampetra fluviatilis]